MTKIGFMGTHGTGKSTKALRLASEIKIKNPGLRVGYVTEVVRSCPWPVNEATTEQAQRWIYHQQIVKELEAERDHNVVVCDRTILDNLAYAHLARFDSLVDDLLPEAVHWMRTYDQVIWLQPQDQPAEDGFRSLDPKFRHYIHEILAFWVMEFGLAVKVESGLSWQTGEDDGR